MSTKIDYTEAYEKTIEKYTTILNKLKEIQKIMHVECNFCSIHNKTKEKCPINEWICKCGISNDSIYIQLGNNLMWSRIKTREILINLIENTIKN